MNVAEQVVHKVARHTPYGEGPEIELPPNKDTECRGTQKMALNVIFMHVVCMY